jgi:hypothetical protein
MALEICTGAAQKRLSVNTPATVAVGASFHQYACGSVFNPGFGIADFDTVDGFQVGGDGQRGINGHFSVLVWVEGKPLL